MSDELPICSCETRVIVLKQAKRRKGYPSCDSIEAIGNEAKKVPRHRVKAQRRTSEQSPDQKKVSIRRKYYQQFSTENAGGEPCEIARRFQPRQFARQVRLHYP